MLIGLIFFVLGKPLLKGKGEAKDPALLEAAVHGSATRMVDLSALAC